MIAMMSGLIFHVFTIVVFTVIQNGSGAHPASYPMGTRGSFPGWPGCEADNSPPSIAKVKE